MARQAQYGGRWLTALLMLAALAAPLLLVGCAAPQWPWQQMRRAVGPLPDAQQILRTALAARPDLNPAEALDPIQLYYWDGGYAQVVSLLYSGLFTLDAHQRSIPALVSDYSVSTDGLRYTFHLRPDARFAEGTPLTAQDVAFSLNRMLTSCPSYGTFAFFDVKDAAPFIAQCAGDGAPAPTIRTLIGDALLTPDPHTLVILLALLDAALISKLAMPYSAIVDQSVVTRYGAQWTAHLADGGGQGTSGMYQLTSLQPWVNSANGLLTLTRAPDYWGPRPRLREVTVAVRHGVASPTATPTCPPSLTPQSAFPVTPTDDLVFDEWASSVAVAPTVVRGLQALTFPALWVSDLTLNPRSAPLNDARLRQALALALDKTALAKLAIWGIPEAPASSATATDHIIPPGIGDYPAALSGPLANAPLTGDVAQAQALWQSYVADKCGGVASHCPTITAFNTGQIATTPLELAMLARWRATLPGIPIAPVEWTGFLTTVVPAPPQASDTLLSQDYADPQDWLLTFAISPGADNGCFSQRCPNWVHDPAADALVARAEATSDAMARLALYQQAENTLINDAVVIPIAQERGSWLATAAAAALPADPAPWIAPAAWARIYLTNAGN
ncbi:MAG TPA: ABC transporter substrate-binding protein [Ktedonobacterales bacterium]|nr:ABC transporter substrate-binding protein [Ktedonobacterales bacterium]